MFFCVFSNNTSYLLCMEIQKKEVELLQYLFIYNLNY